MKVFLPWTSDDEDEAARVEEELQARRVAFALYVEQVAAAGHLFEQRAMLRPTPIAAAIFWAIHNIIDREAPRVVIGEMHEAHAARVVMRRAAPR